MDFSEIGRISVQTSMISSLRILHDQFRLSVYLYRITSGMMRIDLPSPSPRYVLVVILGDPMGL